MPENGQNVQKNQVFLTYPRICNTLINVNRRRAVSSSSAWPASRVRNVRHPHYVKPAVLINGLNFIGRCAANGVVIALADHEITLICGEMVGRKYQ